MRCSQLAETIITCYALLCNLVARFEKCVCCECAHMCVWGGGCKSLIMKTEARSSRSSGAVVFIFLPGVPKRRVFLLGHPRNALTRQTNSTHAYT